MSNAVNISRQKRIPPRIVKTTPEKYEAWFQTDPTEFFFTNTEILHPNLFLVFSMTNATSVEMFKTLLKIIKLTNRKVVFKEE